MALSDETDSLSVLTELSSAPDELAFDFSVVVTVSLSPLPSSSPIRLSISVSPDPSNVDPKLVIKK